MKTIFINNKPITPVEKEKLIKENGRMLYYTMQEPDREKAMKRAVKKYCDFEEIARLGSLFDVSF